MLIDRLRDHWKTSSARQQNDDCFHSGNPEIHPASANRHRIYRSRTRRSVVGADASTLHQHTCYNLQRLGQGHQRSITTTTSHQGQGFQKRAGSKPDSIRAKTLFLKDNLRLFLRSDRLSIRRIVLEEQTFQPDSQEINNDQGRQENQPFILKLIRDLPHSKDREVSRCKRQDESTDRARCQFRKAEPFNTRCFSQERMIQQSYSSSAFCCLLNASDSRICDSSYADVL